MAKNFLIKTRLAIFNHLKYYQNNLRVNIVFYYLVSDSTEEKKKNSIR